MISSFTNISGSTGCIITPILNLDGWFLLFYQVVDDIDMVVSCCFVEWSLLMDVQGIDPGVMIHEKFDDVKVTSDCRQMQRSLIVTAWSVHISI